MIMINVLGGITESREEQHWTRYQLPPFPSLTKLCDAFLIFISYFF